MHSLCWLHVETSSFHIYWFNTFRSSSEACQSTDVCSVRDFPLSLYVASLHLVWILPAMGQGVHSIFTNNLLQLCDSALSSRRIGSENEYQFIWTIWILIFDLLDWQLTLCELSCWAFPVIFNPCQAQTGTYWVFQWSSEESKWTAWWCPWSRKVVIKDHCIDTHT